MTATTPGSTDQPDRKEPEEIIEDLESIKDLLHDGEEANIDKTVPLLDDPVDESVVEDQGIADDTFKALLDDAWQDSVEDLFNDVRLGIERNSEPWSPENTTDLGDALKSRIDASVRTWLGETLEANIGRLRERIVSELSVELLSQMNLKSSQQPPPED